MVRGRDYHIVREGLFLCCFMLHRIQQELPEGASLAGIVGYMHVCGEMQER